MKKFITILIAIIAFLTWNAAAYACEAYDAETIQHTGNYASNYVIEWVEPVEEPTVEEPTVEEPTVESTITETTVEEEQPVITEEPATEEPTIAEEPTVSSSAKAEIKAKEEETEKVAPAAGVTEKHFVQTGLLEDYRALEDKVIYLITALIVAMLAYMPFNRKKAERKEK